MLTHFETNFTIMPSQANYMTPMVFGGALYSEMDLCAAICVNRFLYSSDCKGAVTHKSDVTYLSPTYVGDIIFLYANIIETGKKSIVVHVQAQRENRHQLDRDVIAEGKFVFVSIANADDVVNKPVKLPYKEHGLKI